MTMQRKDGNELLDDRSITEGESRWELAERVAGSKALARATQLRAILLFIVRQAIDHPEVPIHESEIAHRALGRRIDFNPLDDNIVRVQIAHLRKKLDLYFSSDGKDEEMVISIALGSYLPVFSHRAQPALESKPEPAEAMIVSAEEPEEPVAVALVPVQDEIVPELLPASRRPRWARSERILSRLLILALALVCLTLWQQNRALNRAFYPWKYEPAVDLFWSEFLAQNRSTDIVMSDAFFKLVEDFTQTPLTLNNYLSSNYLTQLYAQEKDPKVAHVLHKISGWRSSNVNHLKLAERIVALDPLGKNIHLYYARDYTPELLARDSAILLGSRLSNPWVGLIDNRMNFIAKPDSNDVTVIANRAPIAGEQGSYERTGSFGYCVVAYLPNPSNDSKVLIIEGTSVQATEAGGDFLLSESRMSAFQKMLHVSKFPYFEVLLKTSEIKYTPFTATIEAYRTYPILH
jgi:hypothetical protein